MAIVLDGTSGITNDSGYTGDGVSFADSTPANTLVTTSGGNVGIGTSSPADFMPFGYGPTVETRGGYGGTFLVSNSDNTLLTAFSNNNTEDAGYLKTITNHSLAFGTNDVERMRIDSSGNVGIGTSSPSSVISGTATVLQVQNGNLAALALNNSTAKKFSISSQVSSSLVFYDETASAERARIDSSGNLYLGITTTPGASAGMLFEKSGTINVSRGITTNANVAEWRNPNGVVGTISTNGSSTAYNTSSDYRLKNTIAPMTGALAKVAALKPCTYKWNADGSDGEGFIAHELQEVVPDAVTGEKDAVNEDGSIKPQGIDTSFLVATLTAAIQEQQAIITALTARVEALEGAQA
jgi:hypothetical protein